MNDDPSGSRSPRANGAAETSVATGDDLSEKPGSTGSLAESVRELWRGLAKWRNGNSDSSLRDTFEELIEEEEEEETPVDAEERELLANLLKFRKQTAEDVMIVRADITAVDASSSLSEIVSEMKSTSHSRMPVYRETLDDVIGMIHIKDVLVANTSRKKFDLKSIVRPVMFVAPSMRAVDLLLEMRRGRTHMALVVDEFGGVDGLITIEDVIEEIVGEIEDEFDVVEGPRLTLSPEGILRADARATIEEFEDLVGPVVSEEEREDIDTLGGLVASLAGRVPSRGELIAHPSGVEFEVLDVDPRRIKRLRVRNLPVHPAMPAEIE